jgi:hypothetical protein
MNFGKEDQPVKGVILDRKPAAKLRALRLK